MVRDHTTVWDNCLRTIKRSIPPQSYKTWFEPIKPVSLQQDALTIQVPNKIFYEWLEEHYLLLLKKTIRQELGDQARLEYQILVGKSRAAAQRYSNGNGQKASMVEEDKLEPGKINKETIVNPFVIPGIKKMQIQPQLNPMYTFENFIEGDCNRLARSAGLAVSKMPGTTAFNPLVIFGDVGLGKTHLAQAIGNAINSHSTNKNILYVSSEEFTNRIIDSIRNNAVNDFVNFCQLIDVLIIDDIQFLAGKQKTQEIFFHIFNQLHQNRKQIILTSDRPPKDLSGMEERLLSRFKWGLSADLQVPDLETRMAILKVKMRRENLELPSDVMEFVCYNVKNNIRELEGVLVSLVAQSMLNEKNIDLDLAKDVIKNFISEVTKDITIDFIQEVVAEHFKVTPEALEGKTRKREIVIPRQLSMYLAKKLTSHSLIAIGQHFGGRDHSTVIYSCKTVENLMDTDPFIKEAVYDLEKKLRMSVNGA